MATNDAIDSANIPPPLSHGGTGANLTASNGGILYSDATKAQILAATATGNQPLLSGASGAPGWSTATYPGSTTINRILYSSANNTVTELATANDGMLITSGAGVPSISSTPPSAVLNNIVGRLKSFQVLTSGTGATYTTPAGISSLLVECLGGGGAGGGASNAAGQSAIGGSGGGGGYARKFITSAAATYTYTVGAGGTPGAIGNNPGGNGVNTTFSTITANGGTGGTGQAATATGFIPGGAGGAGASGSGADVTVTGGTGGTGIILAAAGGSVAGAPGGNSFLGAGAYPVVNNGASTTGISAVGNSGGGGSGGGTRNSGTSVAGGAGGSGIIIVWEFS